jgi:hypothetical protein
VKDRGYRPVTAGECAFFDGVPGVF